jgi:hypothetical protein
MKLKYIIEQFRWIKALFSPFTPFKIKWYVGKTQVGVPYFLPRKWVKVNQADCLKLATENTQKKGHIHYGKDPTTIMDEYKNYTKPVPLKVGFSSCGLGWKTKWDQYDFRHEWNPIISFVFFGYQIAMTVYHEHHSHYWESWLCYEYRSDKNKSKRKRVNFCRRKSPQKWSTGHGENKVVTDYWDLILKPKYQRKPNEHK